MIACSGAIELRGVEFCWFASGRAKLWQSEADKTVLDWKLSNQG
jgi:hypothetical protein